ncbi:hypothetical protein AB0L34_15920 [Micromonospora sp. NPDC052213]|uniref:hypothetical protein n=1 Tax=Micromonospora sp. NPDC052213 TaxID=3155812 RepID=UPI0034195474
MTDPKGSTRAGRAAPGSRTPATRPGAARLGRADDDRLSAPERLDTDRRVTTG